MHLAFHLDRKIAEGSSYLLLAGELDIFVIAEDVAQHILDDGNGVGFRDIALSELTNDRLIPLECGDEAILHLLRDFDCRHPTPPILWEWGIKYLASQVRGM